MAEIAQSTTESADSTANDDENTDLTPQPVTGRYLSTKQLLALLKDAIGAADNLSMSDTDKPAVKWTHAVQDAVYEDDGCLGEQQGETDYTTSDYKDTFGDSITTDHADLEPGERSTLLALFQDSENHGGDDLKDQYKLPVVNEERLPVLVADEDVLDEATDLLDEMVNEDNDADSTPDAVDDDEETGEFPVLEGTLDDLEAHLADSTPDEETLREMLEAEQDGKDRKGGRSLIEAAIEERSTTDDDDDDDDETDDDEAGSTSGGMTDEEKEELATTVATAVVEALDN